jgi:predicted enzyme related to lactoylglutathione lyase
MEPVTIPTVGTLAWLEDPAGNALGIMQYEAAA